MIRVGHNNEKRIAVVGILLEHREAAKRVNQILGEYADMVSGRMGIPGREKDRAVIALIIEGTTDEIGALTGKLGNVKYVKVKSAVTA